MNYLKFKIETSNCKEGVVQKIIKNILLLIIPKANPDFDNKISSVQTWCLEFEDMNSVPIREIGLNEKNEVILKMPFKKNYGYWTDNLLKFEDFKTTFRTDTIYSSEFEKKWNELQ